MNSFTKNSRSINDCIPLLIAFVFLLSQQMNVCAQIANEPMWNYTIENVSVFSSPHAADLNSDGVKDIVLGAGQELLVTETGLLAIDGASGELLWSLPADDQVFSSAVFEDFTDDNVPEVVLCGRAAGLYVVDGANGEILWQYYNGTEFDADSLYNFYTPQFIPDHDGDGYKDIVAAYGGDVFQTPDDTIRPPGRLMAISGKTGALLAQDFMPDGKETYCSPIVVDLESDGILDLIYGSGGETVNGHLWRTTVADLLNNDISSSVSLRNGGPKGYIAAPSITDLNSDGVLDVIATSFNGMTSAINGANNELIWEVGYDGYETNNSPAIGQFTEDQVPDVFVTLGLGVWPQYTDHIQLMIDGASGEVLYEAYEGDLLQLNSPIAVDLNEDGKDEGVLTFNTIQYSPELDTTFFQFSVMAHDFVNDELFPLVPYGGGLLPVSSPLIDDLDGDGFLDLVYDYQTDSINVFQDVDVNVLRRTLNVMTPDQIAWGAYLGTDYNGLYLQDSFIGVYEQVSNNKDWQYHIEGELLKVEYNVPGNTPVLSCVDLLGRSTRIDTQLTSEQEAIFDLSVLNSGMYIIGIMDADQAIQHLLKMNVK